MLADLPSPSRHGTGLQAAAGWPAFASRVAWNSKWFGREALFGAGGLFGQQVYGFGRNIDSWLGTIDWNFPLGQYFTLSGEFYRGQAIGGLGGGVWNSVLYNGPQNQATTEVTSLSISCSKPARLDSR